jgi:two-component system CheB/CheR fusion protein
LSEKTPIKPIENSISSEHLFPVVGIGASAGGLEALRELFDALPASTGMAYVVILHLSPEYKSQLAAILSKNTSMQVIEASNNLHMNPNHVYVIPPNAGISISEGSITLEAIKHLNGPPLPIDGFLKSLAEHRRNTAIGVLLSGTGSDGTKGLQKIKAEGGYTFAQRPETAKFSEMPSSAIAQDVVDYVLTIGEIAAKLAEISKKLGALKLTSVEQPEVFDEDSSSKIMSALKARTGIDFNHYKKSTINRRIRRRMILKNATTIEDYATLIKENPQEADALYDDILINVTSFFRDPETYEALSKEVWPKIIRDQPSSEALRFWVPGCSSGEEVYSIAISLLEYLGDKTREFVIFGTDIDEQAIKKARQALYLDDIKQQLSPERLSRFFVKLPDKGYQIRKDIRDKCIFARHNVLTDAPFVNVALVSCRNLMIYLDNYLQDRIIPTFHYSLVKDGVLLLGKSESLGKYGDLFNVVDRTNKIYSKRQADVGGIYSSLVFQPTEFKSETTESKLGRSDYARLLSSMHREVDRIVESSYAPAGVVVNEELEVIEFRGNTDDYLGHSSGAASLNLVKMARGSLSFELRLSVDKAKLSRQSVRVQGVYILDGVKDQKIDFEVVPFSVPSHDANFYLIIFKPRTRKDVEEVEAQAKIEPDNNAELEQLRRGLAETRSHMQSYMEEQEGVKEELRSANEELRASYEELQSMNEELQSSREEIQASNEELRTVNDELANKNSEVNSLYSDLINIVNSTKIPLVMVDNDLKIRRITPMIEKVMKVLPSDVGRPIADLKLNIDIPNLEKLIRESLKDLRAINMDLRSSAGVWYSMRIEPYWTIDNRIDGAVIAFVDVNELLQERSELKEQSVELIKRIGESSEEIVMANERLQEAESAEAIGKLSALLAHDLKNPLNQISQASDMAKADPGKADRMLQIIKENAERSLGMIEELRASTRAINLNRVEADLTSLVQKFVEETKIPDKIKVELKVENKLQTRIDPGLVRRVLDNLVSNAVEAMPKGGTLTISARRVDESIVIGVEDTGNGIPDEAIPRIFDSFYTTKAKGLGLGLAFSKRVVEAHGGTIKFNTIKGSGTTFTVTLPRQK